MIRSKGYQWASQQKAGSPNTHAEIVAIARQNGAQNEDQCLQFLLGALDYGRGSNEPRPIIFQDAKPISTHEIAKANGLTQRRISQLCERGELIGRRDRKLWFVGYEDYCQWWLSRNERGNDEKAQDA